jgi:hypothetical protein
MRVNKGDKVQLRGFQPMSTMEHYEGSCGVVVDIEPNSNMGDVVFVQLTDGTDRIVQTRRQFCEKE